MIWRIQRMLLRPSAQGASVLALPVVAFAIVTTLLSITIGGTLAFWRWSDQEAITYQVLSIVALVLLAVPLVTLGGAAARLSARRRDDRLATLRLLGASTRTVATLTVLEATALAGIGALVGIVAGWAVSPLIGLIPFRGEPLGWAEVALPPLVALILVAGVVVLAAASATMSLRRVIVSPLGVRRRTDAPRVHWIVLALGVAVVAIGYGALSSLAGFGELGGMVLVIGVLGATFACGMAVLGLVGPWVLGVQARMQVRRARTPERLLAARTMLESPKAAWRQVSGVALVSFVGVIAGTGAAFLAELPDAQPGDPAAFLGIDIRTGLIITIVGAYLTVACTVGVQQAAAILDGRDLTRSLHRMGMAVGTIDAARRRAALSPLVLVALGSAICAVVLVLPLAGLALIMQPLSIAIIVATMVLGVGIVTAGLVATRPMVRAAAA